MLQRADIEAAWQMVPYISKAYITIAASIRARFECESSAIRFDIVITIAASIRFERDSSRFEAAATFGKEWTCSFCSNVTRCRSQSEHIDRTWAWLAVCIHYRCSIHCHTSNIYRLLIIFILHHIRGEDFNIVNKLNKSSKKFRVERISKIWLRTKKHECLWNSIWMMLRPIWMEMPEEPLSVSLQQSWAFVIYQ